MIGSVLPGQLTVRADSAFYSKAVLSTAAKFDVRFSITARQDKRVRPAIDAIPDQAWQPIPYWLSTPEVSGADIAEATFTVFAGDKRHARQDQDLREADRPASSARFRNDNSSTADDHRYLAAAPISAVDPARDSKRRDG